MSTIPEKWEEIRELFEAALEVDSAHRSSFVEERCSDPSLCAEVKRLITEHEEAGEFLSTPVLNRLKLVPDVLEPAERLSEGEFLAQRFRIVNFIAAGGMGEIYRADDTHLDRIVALKLLPKVLSEDRQALARFRREAKAASALNHPNICTVYDFAEDRGRKFIAMEHLDGETLSARLKRSACSVTEGIQIALDVASALAAAHDKGIIHRDLKPGNIMLTSNGAKLLDFGIAQYSRLIRAERLNAELSASNERVAGTLPYMSPEQLRGEEADARGDIFSFGAVLYEIFTGKGAFKGHSTKSTIAAVAGEEPAPFRQLAESIPEDLQRIIQRCLKKRPDERYASMLEIERDLKSCEFLVTEPSSRISRKLLVRLAKLPAVAIPSVLALTLLVCLLGWWAYHSSRVRWATDQALPQIATMLEDEKYEEAYALAVEAERYIPHDAMLQKYLSDMSWSTSINTTPSGASIYRKHYNAPDREWELVGHSPIEKLRLPLVDSQWKFELRDHNTVEIATFAIHPPDSITETLDKAGTAPPDMVRVDLRNFGDGSGKVKLYGIPGYEAVPVVTLTNFWIDKFEVTNEQFKQFIDHGGYKKPEYWKQAFVKDGRALSWEEAMKLFRDQTGQPGPATWRRGEYLPGQRDFPVTGISWFEAAAYAEFTGKALPTFYHWIAAVDPLSGPTILPASNFNKTGPSAVGKYEGMSWSGTFDVAGNVKEWILNEANSGKHFILGGAWNEPAYMLYTPDARSPFERSANFGFRCAKYVLNGEEAKAADRIAVKMRNYDSERPVSDQVFKAYKSLYSYDKTPLNPVVEHVLETDAWKEEKITFDAAYGGEKVIAYLFLPKNASPPFQTVVHFSGIAPFYEKSSTNLGMQYQYLEDFEFIVKSGRAVIFPVFKGMFERWDNFFTWPKDSSFYRDNVIDWSKDLGRTIDYLETRNDIDKNKFAFDGLSLGGAMGAILPAVEDRFKAVVLVSPGFFLQKRLPEVDQINFAPHVKAPVLMLNGRYDFYFLVTASQEPMFRLLGTPADQKRRLVYDTGHDIPRADEIRESLNWLDRYLGAVKTK